VKATRLFCTLSPTPPKKYLNSTGAPPSQCTIRVFGIHIAEEDLERIFTPFYRVDKSRNRNSGGSGLGLYITKTILDHHEIVYNMVNTENGVKFTAFLW
jgi:signal transduction histidine kinase